MLDDNLLPQRDGAGPQHFSTLWLGVQASFKPMPTYYQSAGPQSLSLHW